jgi:hypothetical protein
MELLLMGLIVIDPRIGRAAMSSLQSTSTWTAQPRGNLAGPTISRTATFTPVPIVTIHTADALQGTSSPTNTPDPVLAILVSGGLTFTGPLSNDQQISLYRASLNYVEASVQDSLRLAREVNAVSYGDPSNTCGPLAIAILRDARLISDDITPHDYWLLNPFIDHDRKILERTFPIAQFEHVTIPTPINKIDWHVFALTPGDFMYIKHGSWGNFDHMLTVTRVDDGLRAYTVTNHSTAAGFIIDEALLYDPNDRNIGLFSEWTRQEFATAGSTGYGGFELWRRRQP